MDPDRAQDADANNRLPRVSGDGPLQASEKARKDEVAPRERGWTPLWPNALSASNGCPA